MITNFHPSAESAMDLWEQFFRRLVSFLHLTAAREDGATQDVAEATVPKLDSFVSVREKIRQTILDSNRFGKRYWIVTDKIDALLHLAT